MNDNHTTLPLAAQFEVGLDMSVDLEAMYGILDHHGRHGVDYALTGDQSIIIVSPRIMMQMRSTMPDWIDTAHRCSNSIAA